MSKAVAVKPVPGGQMSNKQLMEMLRGSIVEQSKLVRKIQDKLKKGEDVIPLLHEAEATGKRSAVISRYHAISLGQLFGFLKEKWDELPEHFTGGHGGVYEYIHVTYGYQDQMVDMYSTVYEAYFSGRHLRPNDVPNFVRLSDISIVKLRVAAPYIMAGLMTDWRWKLLADESLTRGELSAALRRSKVSNKGKQLVLPGPDAGKHRKSSNGELDVDVVLVRETGDLRIFYEDRIVDIGTLKMGSNDPIVARVVRSIVQNAHIKVRR